MISNDLKRLMKDDEARRVYNGYGALAWTALLMWFMCIWYGIWGLAYIPFTCELFPRLSSEGAVREPKEALFWSNSIFFERRIRRRMSILYTTYPFQ